jgi:hypothetical protein
MAAALTLVALVAAGCSSASTTTTSAPTSTTLATKSITASKPPKLLTSILQFTSGIPTDEFNFTYATDPTNSSWVLFKVNPKPASVGHVQGGYGFAHLVGGDWQFAGPGSSDVGCGSSNSAIAQIKVPAAVFAQFGLKDPCPSQS